MDSPAYSNKKIDASSQADLSESLLERAAEKSYRELSIVGGGLKDGLSNVGTTTASDLKQGYQSFKQNPLEATTGYLKDHWQESAMGAGIAMLAPRGLANKLLLAYCLRDPLISTAKATHSAVFTNDDIGAARKTYGDEMSHQGTALISSLPMTMAGGIAGKLAANSIFGKDLGLSDLVIKDKQGAGKTEPTVSVGDVKANFKDLRYKTFPPAIKRLITDMDNTLIDFSTFESIGIKEGISQIAANLKKAGHEIPEQNLYQMIGKQMDAARSHDYPWSIELALAKPLRVGEPGGMAVSDFNKLAVEPFWQALDKSRTDNIRLFDGVEDTLKKLHQDGKEIVVVSDARADSAIQRLQSTKLSDGSTLLDHVDRIYALAGKEPPADLPPELLAHGQARMKESQAIIDNLPPGKFTTVPSGWEKPNPNSIQLDLQNHPGPNGKHLDPRQTMMVGDSRTKDVKVAENAGMTATWRRDNPNNAVWAKYGDPVDPAVLGVMTRLRPGFEGAGKNEKVYPSQLEAADEFSSILNYMQPRRDYGHLLGAAGKSIAEVLPIKSSLRSSIQALPLKSSLAYSWQPQPADLQRIQQLKEMIKAN